MIVKMTIIEASNKIIAFFQTNESLVQLKTGTDDLNKALLIISDNPEADRAAGICALMELERKGIIQSLHYPDKTFWILTKPFAAYEQTITIDFPLALAISELINACCESLNDKKDVCTSTSVTTHDIRNLYLIAANLASGKKS
jgi:hypothetical protein